MLLVNLSEVVPSYQIHQPLPNLLIVVMSCRTHAPSYIQMPINQHIQKSSLSLFRYLGILLIVNILDKIECSFLTFKTHPDRSCYQWKLSYLS